MRVYGGDSLRLTIDHDTSLTDGFNLTVSEIATQNGRQAVAREERWRQPVDG
jgi:hypothetical protein